MNTVRVLRAPGTVLDWRMSAWSSAAGSTSIGACHQHQSHTGVRVSSAAGRTGNGACNQPSPPGCRAPPGAPASVPAQQLSLSTTLLLLLQHAPCLRTVTVCPSGFSGLVEHCRQHQHRCLQHQPSLSTTHASHPLNNALTSVIPGTVLDWRMLVWLSAAGSTSIGACHQHQTCVECDATPNTYLM